MAGVLIIGSIAKAVRRTEQEEINYRNEKRALLAILITVAFQILVVAKNYYPYAQYYIVPSLMFSITGLAFMIPYTLKTFKA